MRPTTVARAPAAQCLRGAYLFRAVADSVLADFHAAARMESFREGEMVWRAGDPACSFTVILRGLVLVQRSTLSGDCAIVGVFGPKESIGDVAALERAAYPASACALSELVDVVRVPADLVLEAMQRDPNLMRGIHGALIRHTNALQAKIDIVSAGSVSARLAMLFLHLAERFGDEDEAQRTIVPVSLSRAALSRLVSARMETVIRVLSAWQKHELMRNVQGGVEIPDLTALRAIACEG